MDSSSHHFTGLHVGSLLTQPDSEVSKWVAAHGGKCSILVCSNPTDLQLDPQLARFANQLLVGEIDLVVFCTLAGVNRFFSQASRNVDLQRLLDSLTDITTIAGSQSAAVAFRRQGIEPTIEIERSSSWREILIEVDRRLRINHFTVGIETTGSVHGLSAGLEARGGRVIRIPVFLEPNEVDEASVSDYFEGIASGDLDALLFASPEDAARFCFLMDRSGRGHSTSRSLEQQIVLCIGEDTASLLHDHHIKVDWKTVETQIPKAIDEFAENMKEIKRQHQRLNQNLSGPATSGRDANAPWYDSPFMKACRGEPTDVTPIWMMRQAGRYMEEYRAVRSKVSFLELCANPQLCSEVMCTAVNRLGVDAAIIFSDLLPILVPMGMDLEFVKGDGPVIHNPIRSSADVDRIKPLASVEPLHFVMETVTQTRNDLPADLPLIGFAGAPFTLASYMIEGGASRNYAHTKAFMYSDPGAWDQLMQHLANSISIYLNGQVDAGAQVLQLFDSWAGCLAFDDYKNFILPYVKQVISSLPTDVPIINFATGNPALLPLLADTHAGVIGIDWRVRLDEAWQTVGYDRAVQGNLDPTTLLTNREVIKQQAKSVLDQAAGRPGHIFNLGHGILPQTPVDNAIALIDIVHDLSQRKRT